MARPAGGAVDPTLKRTYGGARRGSHHVALPYLGKPSRKPEGETRESCDSEEEDEQYGAGKGTEWLSTPGSRPLAELQESKAVGPVKAVAVSTSKPPLPDRSAQQENLLPAPSVAHRKQHPTPKLNHKDNYEQAAFPRKFATDGNVSLNSATALDGSCSYSAMELERHHLLPSLPHSAVVAHSSRMQPAVIPKREVAPGPTPELHHCTQGSGREEVGHLRGIQDERALLPPDLHSQDWLALPDMNKKKWVIKVSHLGRGGFSEVHSVCLSGVPCTNWHMSSHPLPLIHLRQVLKVLSVEDREMYALKVVNLTDQAMEEALANEVRILKKLQGHPQIVQLKEL